MHLPQSCDDRLRQIEGNLWQFGGYPRLGRPSPERDGLLAVVGFGTSLLDTWEDVRNADAIVTTSGGHDFLIKRGIVPTYHVEIDPRPHKAFFLRHSHPQVHYMIGSQCHPSLFAQLYAKKRRVTICHHFTDEDRDRQVALIRRFEPNAVLLAGGTNAGLRANIVGRHLGWRRFMLLGIDCSYKDGEEWAGPHSGMRHDKVKVKVAGRVFSTSDIMMQATDDFFNQMFMIGGCEFTIKGDGLLATRLEIYRNDPALACSPKWWEPVDFALKAEA